MDFDAITLDTCALENQNFNLENGLLARFEQFSKTKNVVFIMSEIVLKEMISHIEEDTKASISKYIDAMKKGLFYKIDEEITEEKIKTIKKTDVKAIVKRRIKRFVEKTGLQIISTDSIDIQKIIENYFNKTPPFSKKKKDEFPDALALQSLENWAKENNKRLLVISDDKDWQAYCQNSDAMVCVKSIEDALSSLYKDEDFAKQSLIDIFAHYDKYECLMNSICEKIMNSSDRLSINLDISSRYEAEEEYLEPEFIDVYFPKPTGVEIIEINETKKVLTFSIPVDLMFHIESGYTFYTDSEGDYIDVGHNTISDEFYFPNNLIISINLNDKNINKSEIISIDFKNYSLSHSTVLDPYFPDYYDY